MPAWRPPVQWRRTLIADGLAIAADKAGNDGGIVTGFDVAGLQDGSGINTPAPAAAR